MTQLLFITLTISKLAVISTANIKFALLLNYIAVTLTSLRLNTILPKRSLFLIIFSILFAIGNQYQASISCLLLLGVAKIYAYFIYNLSRRRAFLYAISLIVILIFLDLAYFIRGDFESTYGRNQLLLGIFHPKEQAIFIIFVYISFYVIPKNGSITFLSYVLVLSLLYLTDARIHIVAFLLFGLSYLLGGRLMSVIGMTIISILPFFTFYILQYWEYLNWFSSNRLELWKNLFFFGYSSGALSIDSSWLEFGRNNTYVFILFLPVFLIFCISIVIDTMKQYHSFFGAIYIYFLISNSTDIGAFSATNMFSMVFWSTYLYGNKLKFSNRSNVDV